MSTRKRDIMEKGGIVHIMKELSNIVQQLDFFRKFYSVHKSLQFLGYRSLSRVRTAWRYDESFKGQYRPVICDVTPTFSFLSRRPISPITPSVLRGGVRGGSG